MTNFEHKRSRLSEVAKTLKETSLSNKIESSTTAYELYLHAKHVQFLIEKKASKRSSPGLFRKKSKSKAPSELNALDTFSLTFYYPPATDSQYTLELFHSDLERALSNPQSQIVMIVGEGKCSAHLSNLPNIAEVRTINSTYMPTLVSLERAKKSRLKRAESESAPERNQKSRKLKGLQKAKSEPDLREQFGEVDYLRNAFLTASYNKAKRLLPDLKHEKTITHERESQIFSLIKNLEPLTKADLFISTLTPVESFKLIRKLVTFDANEKTRDTFGRGNNLLNLLSTHLLELDSDWESFTNQRDDFINQLVSLSNASKQKTLTQEQLKEPLLTYLTSMFENLPPSLMSFCAALSQEMDARQANRDTRFFRVTDDEELDALDFHVVKIKSIVYGIIINRLIGPALQGRSELDAKTKKACATLIKDVLLKMPEKPGQTIPVVLSDSMKKVKSAASKLIYSLKETPLVPATTTQAAKRGI